MTCVTGVSGSGKSTLINDTLFRIAHRELNKATESSPALSLDIEGLEHLDKVVDIDQSPIGRTPRSNPATYTGLFTPDPRAVLRHPGGARSRGYQPGRFSQREGDAARRARGRGHQGGDALPAGTSTCLCDVCKGKRYNRETLEVKHKGKNIHEVLEMTVEDARAFLRSGAGAGAQAANPDGCGLSYIRLGQSATTPLRRRGAAGQAGAGAPPSGTPARPSTSWTNRPRAALPRYPCSCSLQGNQLRDRATIIIIEQ